METLKLFVELLPVNIIQGMIYALVALGIMIPLRILSFPDLTSEGSVEFFAILFDELNEVVQAADFLEEESEERRGRS